MACANEGTSRDQVWPRIYCINCGHYHQSEQLENKGRLYMTRCQAVCPEVLQEFSTERTGLEQAGEASWKREPQAQC